MNRFAAATLILLASLAPARADWPTLHKDLQRSGYTDEVLAGPLHRIWYRSLVEEMVGPRCEPIVAEGLCFVGTYAGNLYALDIRDGAIAWQFKLPGRIGHSPCYQAGKVYACSDDGYRSGSVVCLTAKEGKPAWRYRTDAGVWNSPACDGTKVYVGDRGGVFHAIDCRTGQRAWTLATGATILKPASISADGRQIVVGSEDLHVRCVSPEGKLLWTSAKLPGLSLRDAAPTLWAGKVVVRTNPARPFHESLHEGSRLVCGIQRKIPLDPAEDHVFAGTTENQYFLRLTPRRERAENEGVVEYLKQNPHSRTWHTMNLSDGQEPWIAPVMYTAGLHNPPTPPTFNPKTQDLYTFMPTALGVYSDGVSQVGVGVGRVDPATGRISNMAHAEDDRVPGYWAGMTMIADETSALSLMGDFLVATHQGAVGGVDLSTRKLRTLCGHRDTYGGLFGPGIAPGGWDGSKKLAEEGFVQNMVNEWHGPDRSIAAIDGGRLFWISGSCVVAYAGRDVPAAETGGDQPPAPWKWNRPRRIDGGNLVGSLGQVTTSPKKTLDAAALEPYLTEPSARQSSATPLAADLRRRLDAAVTELVEGHPWAMWIVQLGISHEEQHFWRSADMMRVVAMALPHLSPPVRAKAIAFLDRLFDEGVPLDRPVIGAEGRRREWHDLPPDMLQGKPPQASADVADLYAVWAYAHYANRWDKVAATLRVASAPVAATLRVASAGLQKILANAADGTRSVPATEVALLNGQIAGMIGCVRILRHTGRDDEAKEAVASLARLVAERVQIEACDSRLLSVREHHQWLSRYMSCTPELGRILADHAGTPLKANLAALNRELPVWYQAWGERLIGGENYISPPTLAEAMFLATAYGLRTSPETLARYLDQPWCRADLYYLEKLTAMLQAP